MRNWQDVTLGDIGRGLSRYSPFISIVVAVLLIAAVLPGRSDRSPEEVAAGGTDGGPSVQTTDTTAPASTDTSVAGPGGDTAMTVAAGGGAAGRGTGRASGGTAGAGPGGGAGASGGAVQVQGGVGPDCDTARGRIKVPSHYAPPCAPPFSGDNGGATSPGVTRDSITVVWYDAASNAAADAALRAAGAADDPEAVKQAVHQYFEMLSAHWERYGRKVDLKWFEGTAESDDDAAGRSDAIKVADLKPFLVINAPNNGFVDVLASRKIICICTVSQPQELYERYAPYVGYTTLMASTQGYIHRAEYVGKRLAGRPAKHAGTRDGIPMNTEARKFGLLWYETADHAYASGVEFFKKELAKYKVTLAADVAYNGFPDVAATQEQARPAITKLKNAGINTLIFSGDPIAPAIFTQEATRQTWFPEWIITGSALVDTTLFARTYAPEQWVRAYGISFLSARIEPSLGDAYRLLKWHNGQAPAAPNTYPVIYAPIWITFTGIHMAGPNLTPQSFSQGLFNYPVSGKGLLTAPTVSYGKHGIWPFVDYTAYDDVTEIWWDPQSSGKDEVGHDGPGMYAYVDGGRRYMPGEHPNTDPKAFVRDGSQVTFYTQLPKSDEPPQYDHAGSPHKKP